MKRKKFFRMCFALLIVFFILSLATMAQKEKKEEKELVLGITGNPFVTGTSLAGKGTADAREIFQTASDAFRELYGYNVTLKIYPAPKFLFKAIQDKTVALSPLSFALYLHAKKTGIAVKPFIMASSTQRKEDKFCIYVHKDSGIKNVKQLQGKSFVSAFPMFLSNKDALPPKESYIYWIMVKKILAQNGVNKPFKDFFKEIRVLPVAYESVMYSIMLKKFDACYSNPNYHQVLINYDKGFSDIVSISCLDMPVQAPFVYRSDVSPEVVKNITNFLLHPPKTKETKKIQKEFKGIKLFPVEEKDYTIYFKWLKEAEKKGWIDEFDEIMKNTPLPKRKGRVK